VRTLGEVQSIEKLSNHTAKINLILASAIKVLKALHGRSPNGADPNLNNESSSAARVARRADRWFRKDPLAYWLPTGCHAAHRGPPLREADPLSTVRGTATDAWRRLPRSRCGVAAPCPASSARPPSKKPCSPACAVRAPPADTRPAWRLVHRSCQPPTLVAAGTGVAPPAETATTRAVEGLARPRPWWSGGGGVSRAPRASSQESITCLFPTRWSDLTGRNPSRHSGGRHRAPSWSATGQRDAWPQRGARWWCRGGGGCHGLIARELPNPAAHENADATQICSPAPTPVEAAL